MKVSWSSCLNAETDTNGHLNRLASENFVKNDIISKISKFNSKFNNLKALN